MLVATPGTWTSPPPHSSSSPRSTSVVSTAFSGSGSKPLLVRSTSPLLSAHLCKIPSSPALHLFIAFYIGPVATLRRLGRPRRIPAPACRGRSDGQWGQRSHVLLYCLQYLCWRVMSQRSTLHCMLGPWRAAVGGCACRLDHQSRCSYLALGVNNMQWK